MHWSFLEAWRPKSTGLGGHEINRPEKEFLRFAD